MFSKNIDQPSFEGKFSFVVLGGRGGGCYLHSAAISLPLSKFSGSAPEDILKYTLRQSYSSCWANQLTSNKGLQTAVIFICEKPPSSIKQCAKQLGKA